MNNNEVKHFYFGYYTALTRFEKICIIQWFITLLLINLKLFVCDVPWFLIISILVFDKVLMMFSKITNTIKGLINMLTKKQNQNI